MDYIDHIVSIPIPEFLNYIYSDKDSVSITAKDVFQFSNLEDATTNLCCKLIDIDNPGIAFIDAGKMLQADGISRKPGADTKYGENHLKTAEILGLVYELTKVYFLSCIGMIYPKLLDEDREKLLVRLILRSNMVRRLVNATKNGNVQLRQFLYMLSDSTYIRRRSNVRSIFSVLKTSGEYDFSSIIDQISFDAKSNLIQYDFKQSSDSSRLKVAEDIIEYNPKKTEK